MNYSIINKALTALSNQRPVFCSEADFQFTFSEALRVYLPNAKIRLERPFLLDDDITTYHVDIWVEDDGKIYPIELKYKTRECRIEYNNETFRLKDQSASDLGRYDYVADIKRIENIKRIVNNRCKDRFGEGYAIMLTNEKSYYNPPMQNHKQTMDCDFRIHQGANLTGQLRWRPTPNSQIADIVGNRGSRTAINLSGNYTMSWTAYSNIPDVGRNIIEMKQCVTIIK